MPTSRPIVIRLVWLTSLLLTLAILTTPAAAQDLPFLRSGNAAAGPKTTVSASANFDRVQPGQQVVVAVVLDVAEGWHAQSHEPLVDYLIPFRIAVDESAEHTAYAPQYAEPHLENYPLISPETDGDLSVYTGQSVHYVPVEIAVDAEGAVQIDGSATLQICDDETCLPPETLPWSVELPVVAGSADVSPANTDLFAGFDPATWTDLKPIDGANGAARIAAQPVDLFGWELDLARIGPVAVLLLAFIAGIFFNVVPCVLPVLPLKIINFYETAQHSRAKCFAHGLAFSFGIVLTFAALALLIFVFQTITWGEMFSNPYFAGTVTLVLVAAAAYQFGLFTVMLPANVYAAEQSATTGKGAVVGNVAAGAFTAILSTPCTFGLFFGVLLWAAAQPAWLGVSTITVVGVGMAFPYLLLSLFPQVARKLPRSGKWSEVVKQATGFVLLAVAVYFAKPLLPDALRGPALWWVIYGCVAAGALYLVAAAIRFGEARGIVISGLVALVLAGGTLPIAYRLANPPAGWVYYSDAALAAALEKNQPVVVKFTADWCANCQTVEQMVFGTQAQMDAWADQGVTLIKADLTRRDAPGWPLLTELNPARAIPYTAVYLPGADDPKPLVGIYDSTDLQAALGSKPTTKQLNRVRSRSETTQSRPPTASVMTVHDVKPRVFAR